LQPEENNPTLKIKVSMAMVLAVDVKQLHADTIHKQNHATTKIKLMDQFVVAPILGEREKNP
jgi:hypothetical protein